MSTEKKPNIYDVAKLAEVSHQTVSRVLNGHASIRPETRERVEAAMKSLGYRPNRAARALVTSKNNMLGFLVSDNGLYGPAGMLYAMEREARNAGYFAISIAIRYDDPESWREGIEHLKNLGVEGIAVIALKSEAMEKVLTAFPRTPMVAIDTEDVPQVRAVGIDNRSGAVLATQHLIDLGHRSILHIAGPEYSAEARARREGYEQTMKQAGLSAQVLQGDWSADTGFKLGVDLNLELAGVTGIFAANDHLCLGLLKALRMRTIDVPGRVSLIGFDDVPESTYFVPPLTTVRQDFNRLGESAMEILLGELSGQSVRTKVSVQPELVVRESTARLES